jgi:hypothetical protein
LTGNTIQGMAHPSRCLIGTLGQHALVRRREVLRRSVDDSRYGIRPQVAQRLDDCAALSDQVDGNVDVAACCFRVRTDLVCFVDQGLSGSAIDAWKADVEPSTEELTVISDVQIHFGVDRDPGRQDGVPLSSRKGDRAFEAG